MMRIAKTLFWLAGLPLGLTMDAAEWVYLRATAKSRLCTGCGAPGGFLCKTCALPKPPKTIWERLRHPEL